MRNLFFLAVISLLWSAAFQASADDLTKMIEADLAALGYDTGAVDGKQTLETQIAISQFQAENELEVTGEVSPQLAGVIKSKMKQAGSTPASTPAATPMTEEERVAAEQACLERKMAEAEADQEKKKGWSSLINSISRTASRYAGDSDIARDVSETTRDIADANATKEDFEQTARDMGLSDDDIEACKQTQ